MLDNDFSPVVEADKAHVWHHLFQHKALESRDPRIIVEGKGLSVWDQNGREFLDAVSGGVWTVNVGYGRESIADAVREQLVKMNYFAGAAMMPYGRFLAAAQEARHDLELLASRFGASIEQVAHRLSTLQRPGAKGIPFFFARVDQAGTITKRHSATRLQFARFGGACPLWNVHRAFETPGRFLRQLAETPDGVRYVLLARDVTKRGGHFGAPVRRYAMALGCEVRHAGALVYADGLGLDRDGAFEPIGISCRICERTDCHQRSVPPLEKRLAIHPERREVLPYALE